MFGCSTTWAGPADPIVTRFSALDLPRVCHGAPSVVSAQLPVSQCAGIEVAILREFSRLRHGTTVAERCA
jgi:hypothetical protein